MCAVAYLIQVRALERETLALQALRPHLEEKAKLPTVAEAVAEFDQWLSSVPQQKVMTAVDAEREALYAALGVGQGRR